MIVRLVPLLSVLLWGVVACGSSDPVGADGGAAADSDADSDTDADTDTDSDADTDSDTDADGDTDMDGDTDTDVDTGAGTCSEPYEIPDDAYPFVHSHDSATATSSLDANQCWPAADFTSGDVVYEIEGGGGQTLSVSVVLAFEGVLMLLDGCSETAACLRSDSGSSGETLHFTYPWETGTVYLIIDGDSAGDYDLEAWIEGWG